MNVNSFRIRIEEIKTENDRLRLSELAHQHYSDVFIEIHDTLGYGKEKGGTPTDFEIDASNKGIFVLKKLVRRFDPWITVEGQIKLDRTDIPDELFNNVGNGGVGKHWSDAKERIERLDLPKEMDKAEYFRVRVQQFDKFSNDHDYLNKVRHNHADAFISVHELYGPEDVEVGTPQEFSLSNDIEGLYVLKKVIEKFDPWIEVSAIKRYDRVDMPDELFQKVDEGGVGTRWSEKAGERIANLDWP